MLSISLIKYIFHFPESIIYAIKSKIFKIKISNRFQGLKIMMLKMILERKLIVLNIGNNMISIKYDSDIIYLRTRDQSDFFIFYQILCVQEYKPILSLLKSPMSIVDAGANIGLSSLYFRKAFPNAKIVAIEPDEENFKIAQMNLSDKVILLQKALWPRKTKLKIANQADLSMSLQCFEDPENGNIEVIAHDEIMALFPNGIDLLKIDIEGGEFGLFQDHESACYFKENCKVIAIEIHKRFASPEIITSKLIGFKHFTHLETEYFYV